MLLHSVSDLVWLDYIVQKVWLYTCQCPYWLSRKGIVSICFYSIPYRLLEHPLCLALGWPIVEVRCDWFIVHWGFWVDFYAPSSVQPLRISRLRYHVCYKIHTEVHETWKWTFNSFEFTLFWAMIYSGKNKTFKHKKIILEVTIMDFAWND